MELEELLERQDIPKDVKEAIQRGIDIIMGRESKNKKGETAIAVSIVFIIVLLLLDKSLSHHRSSNFHETSNIGTNY